MAGGFSRGLADQIGRRGVDKPSPVEPVADEQPAWVEGLGRLGRLKDSARGLLVASLRNRIPLGGESPPISSVQERCPLQSKCQFLAFRTGWFPS